MKKKFMLFLMAVMVSFSAICFASHGTDLDAEEKIVDQFFAGKDYNKVTAFMDPSLAKDLTAERYNNMFTEMNKDLGKMTEKNLRVYQVFDDGHVLSYAAKFEKGAVLALDVVFKAEKGKFSIVNFRIFDPTAQAPAQADNKAEKK
ncbi:MAG: hypothetical protein J5915_11715 [Acidaminococcaceae bacterium]|jgi:hypothetical protein|nr:hypothetical protein [Acidaminococcaceae bacterium]MBO6182707.1 hypothetical protein [Acidaminococcaceae bacterium]MBP3264390.1 hypothetical protein [Acidaminococcaceae bacterium]MBQ5344562.1 hypothetical protein [Acidaminococcaceae bacterium]MBQ7417318.1 hypothetical protein [Acidaminococcaceae bacterium]